jgi:hypothetical protein
VLGTCYYFQLGSWSTFRQLLCYCKVKYFVRLNPMLSSLVAFQRNLQPYVVMYFCITFLILSLLNQFIISFNEHLYYKFKKHLPCVTSQNNIIHLSYFPDIDHVDLLPMPGIWNWMIYLYTFWVLVNEVICMRIKHFLRLYRTNDLFSCSRSEKGTLNVRRNSVSENKRRVFHLNLT